MIVAATRIHAKVDLTALREVAALDVRPLVACIEQCEQIAAPFYRIGEIQALINAYSLAENVPVVYGGVHGAARVAEIIYVNICDSRQDSLLRVLREGRSPA